LITAENDFLMECRGKKI